MSSLHVPIVQGEIVPRRLSAWMQSLGLWVSIGSAFTTVDTLAGQLPPERGTIYRIKDRGGVI